MHLVLLAAVTWGWEASSHTTQVQVPRYVEAKLVQLKPQAKAAAQKPQVNKVDLVAKRKAQEQKRRAAEEKRRQEEARKAAAAKAKRERERKEQAAELERQRQLEEQQKLEEQRQREEQRQQQQLALEAQMASELEQEQSLLLEEQYATEAQSYVALIASRIEDNWNPPPSARRGMKCKLTLQLVPTGRVVNVTVSESSGNSAFDRSALQAVKKVEQFPEVQKIPPALFEREFRTITLLFNPRDLRL
ncbi:cell envelope integrity protein TolA [Exilibacterium tricleocarpae]|uniref:Cell envelope integrity protein TolA n=2 Tax=Exilibacterium tricleocarpae TaxID=2591008 RepID=A0A545UA07_9GAMM|nr:cell envelope integrity protein TolA [Exilibacterium tricleocarpae]